MRKVLLVRHPETEANAAGRHVARGDSAYSERGEGQLAHLVDGLCAWGPDALACSPQRRALTPALASSRACRAPLRIDPGLAEFDMGNAEGLSHEEGVARGLILPYDVSDPSNQPFDGGERIGEFAARCEAAWRRLLATPGERLAAVSHRGVLRYVAVHALGLPIDAVWRLRIDPAQSLLLTVTDGYAVLDSLGPLPVPRDDGTMHPDP